MSLDIFTIKNSKLFVKAEEKFLVYNYGEIKLLKLSRVLIFFNRIISKTAMNLNNIN